MAQGARGAWDDYWARETKGGGHREQRGCLPNGGHGIDDALRRVWCSFADGLPKGARVLDLATGDARVPAWLLEARRDLKPVGVDRACELPAPPRGVKVRSDTAIEDLPFPDDSFAAVTSQFGLEYGDVESAAAEIGRVARPGAAVGLICHRRDGPIVSHNLARRKAIAWAVDERDLGGIAKLSLQLRASGLAAIPADIAAAPAQGAARFGTGSAAWEIAEAIRQAMLLGAARAPFETAGAIDAITAAARGEMARITALENAAQAACELGDRLATAGLEVVANEPVQETGHGPAFADFLTLRVH